MQFQSPNYALYDLLVNKKRIELKLNQDEYREYKKKKIVELTSSYSKEDYDILSTETASLGRCLLEYQNALTSLNIVERQYSDIDYVRQASY
jgi:hypothetical protein